MDAAAPIPPIQLLQYLNLGLKLQNIHLGFLVLLINNNCVKDKEDVDGCYLGFRNLCYLDSVMP